MGYIVAVTGGIGSGKSTLSALFATLGVSVIEADDVARRLMAPGTLAFKAIVAHFGTTVVREDGALDRSNLRTHLCNDPTEREWLERLLHPLIYQESWRLLAMVNAPYALWVVPLLIEKKWSAGTQRTLVVDVSVSQQLTRLMYRDGMSYPQARAMLSMQCDRQSRFAYADDIVDNSGDRTLLPARVMALHQYYLNLVALRSGKDAAR